MRATLSLILVLALAAGAFAHNGEVPPSPPPNTFHQSPCHVLAAFAMASFSKPRDGSPGTV